MLCGLKITKETKQGKWINEWVNLLQHVIPSAYKIRCILEQSESVTTAAPVAETMPADSAGAASCRAAAMNDCQRASHLQYAE